MFFNIHFFYRMLDEFGNELDNTETKLDSTMKKVAKVLHMSNGKSEYIFLCLKCVLL